MSEVQDPDIFINEVCYLRDELVYMGEFTDDSMRVIRAKSIRAHDRNTLRHRGLTLPANV